MHGGMGTEKEAIFLSWPLKLSGYEQGRPPQYLRVDVIVWVRAGETVNWDGDRELQVTY